MKILIDARLYGIENAGLGRYVTNLISGLSAIDKNNDYVILLTSKYFNELILPSNWKKILADYRHYSFSEQIYLSKLIRKENPDLTHFPHFNVPIMYNGNFVVTIHDLLMHKNVGLAATTLIPPLYYIKRLGYKTVFRTAVMRAKKIIVPSYAVKNEVLDYYKISPGKIGVIYEGFDANIESYSDGGKTLSKYNIKDKYFVYAGNAYPHKNLKRLVEAVVLLNKNSDEKTILTICSARNIFTQRLSKIVEHLNAREYVKLLGFVPDKDLATLYKNSLGFVFPSLSEGFGLPGLEAMTVGTPVLASQTPVFEEIYKNQAVYFNPYDFSSIERAMQGVIVMAPEKRREMIEEGRDFAKRYSWAKMAKETLKLYEETGSNSLR